MARNIWTPLGKKCFHCGIFKSKSEYNKNKSQRAGYEAHCRSCNRKIKLFKDYGLTVEQYDKMLKEQGNRCAICRAAVSNSKKDSFAVDHDHDCCSSIKSCGKCVRGLLCHMCNISLGQFKRLYLLEKAMTYLKKYGASF